MRINEILVESKSEVNEAPVGFMSQGIKKVGAGIASRIPGMKSTTARLRGEVEAGNLANDLYISLHNNLGKSGDDINLINADYVANFLKSQGLNSFGLKGKVPLGKAQVEKAILDTVKNNYRGSAPRTAFPPVSAMKKSGTSAVTPTGKMTYGQVKSALQQLKPSERAKILQMLQAETQPTRPQVTKTSVKK